MEQLWAYSVKTIQEETSVSRLPKTILKIFKNRQDQYPPVRMSELNMEYLETKNDDTLLNNQKLIFKSPGKNGRLIKIKIVIPKGVNANNIIYYNDLLKNTSDHDLKVTEENTINRSNSISSCEEALPDITIPNVIKRYNPISPCQTANKNEFRLSDPLQTSTLRSNSSSIRERRNAIKSEDIFHKHFKNPGVPIMGRHALLTKANKNLDTMDSKDSMVVKELVLNKYHDILEHYRKRNLERKKSRIASLLVVEDDHYEESPTVEQTEQDSFKDNTNNDSWSASYETINPSQDTSEIMNFMKSTDDLNKECTSYNSTIGNAFDDTSEIVEYDSKVFLQEALGDELKNMSISSLNFKENSPSSISNKVNRANSSISSSQLSLLLSKEGSIYSTVSKKLSKTWTLPKLPVQNESYDETLAEESLKYEEITRELTVQNSILFQVSKAIRFCKLNKEFCFSTERIEAEKILLITSCKIELLNEELLKLDQGKTASSDTNNFGSIEIKNVKFALKSIENFNKNKNVSEYYMCILTCGSEILASGVSLATNGLIYFNGPFIFSKLLPNFKIDLSLFSMKLRNGQENKFIKEMNLRFPVASKFSLRRNSRKKNLSNADVDINPSAFTFCGKHSITLENHNSAGLLQRAPSSSMVCNRFSFDVKSSANVKVKMAGFLTISRDKGGCALWNRHWCVLNGSTLYYYNYPCEENVTKHLGEIKLNEISTVGIAPRSICSRPKTLILENTNHETNVSNRYFLSTDSLQEMKMWEKKLSSVINNLYKWNNCK